MKIDNSKLTLTVYFYLFNKIKYFKLSEKIDLQKIIKNAKYKNINISLKNKKKYVNVIKKLKIKIENLSLAINIGIIDINITNFIVFISSTGISMLLGYLYNKPNIKMNNINYAIKPFYNRDTFQINLNTTISIKIKHIIYMLYLIIKARKN